MQCSLLASTCACNCGYYVKDDLLGKGEASFWRETSTWPVVILNTLQGSCSILWLLQALLWPTQWQYAIKWKIFIEEASSFGNSTDVLNRQSCSSHIWLSSSFEATPSYNMFLSCYKISQPRTRENYLTWLKQMKRDVWLWERTQVKDIWE
jgi:hypothetical protein